MNPGLENILSTMYKTGMVEWLNAHPEAFDDAVHLALDNRQPYSWRSAWLLCTCMKPDDSRIQPYIKNMIDVLHHRKDGHARELIKILSQMDVAEEHTAELFDSCVSLWEQIHRAPSVRYMAFRMIITIISMYPELLNEITFLTQNHYIEPLSPGIRNSVLRMIQKLQEKREQAD
jgi:hypothetical protein